MYKNIFFTVCCMLFFMHTTLAQEIEDCKGNTMQQMDLLSKTAVFNNVGINLNKYDWSEPVVNCHINGTLSSYKQYKSMNALASTAAGIGIGLLTLGIINLDYGDNSGILIAGGVAFTGSAIPLIIFGRQKKKKSNRHLNQVSAYYRQNNLF